ncbi:MAG: radical SAM protein, partial [Candidatus Omnitrophota bacterium]
MKQLFRRKNIFDNPLSEWEAYTKDHKSFNFPERIIIELTNRCNLTCIMCPRNNVKMELGDMPMSMFKNIIDEVACFLPVCVVPFFRGESFLHPQFLEMVSYAKIKNLKPIQIATNACFLTYDMTKKFLDLGVDFISFSIDVNYANIYEKIRKNSDFEKVFSNVLAFIKEK